MSSIASAQPDFLGTVPQRAAAARVYFSVKKDEGAESETGIFHRKRKQDMRMEQKRGEKIAQAILGTSVIPLTENSERERGREREGEREEGGSRLRRSCNCARFHPGDSFLFALFN